MPPPKASLQTDTQEPTVARLTAFCPSTKGTAWHGTRPWLASGSTEAPTSHPSSQTVPSGPPLVQGRQESRASPDLRSFLGLSPSPQHGLSPQDCCLLRDCISRCCGWDALSL